MFIYHYLFTLVLKSPNEEWPITYTFTYIYIYSFLTFNRQVDIDMQMKIIYHEWMWSKLLFTTYKNFKKKTLFLEGLQQPNPTPVSTSTHF